MSGHSDATSREKQFSERAIRRISCNSLSVKLVYEEDEEDEDGELAICKAFCDELDSIDSA